MKSTTKFHFLSNRSSTFCLPINFSTTANLWNKTDNKKPQIIQILFIFIFSLINKPLSKTNSNQVLKISCFQNSSILDASAKNQFFKFKASPPETRHLQTLENPHIPLYLRLSFLWNIVLLIWLYTLLFLVGLSDLEGFFICYNTYTLIGIQWFTHFFALLGVSHV